MAQPSERGFRYQRRSADDVRKRANAKGGDFDSMFKSKYKVYKIKDGKNVVRILPPTWDNADHYGYDLWINYSVGPDNQSYLSLKRMKNERDPLDEARREAQRSGDKELAKVLTPKQRILMWVIDRMNEDEGPQLLPCPFTVDKAIAALSFDEDTKETLFIDDPKTGNDVRFYKEGSGLKTDYPPEKMRILKSSPLSQDKAIAQDWLDFVSENPLPECIEFYDYDHIAETFDGQVPAARDDDAEEPPPARSRAAGNGGDEDDYIPPKSERRLTAAVRKVEAEMDDEPVDEPPSRRRAAIADEPDDEPEPPPRRTRPVADEPPDDEPEPPSRRRFTPPTDEEDYSPPPKSSIRERLSQRRSRLSGAEDD